MTKKIKNYILSIVVIVLLVFGSVVFIDNVFKDISQSHIDANIPTEQEFDEFLTRDIDSYFEEIHKKEISVKFELLREGPTQSGVAYPKYYAWVTIYDGEQEIEQGAVRVAAISKNSFDVTDYISLNQIRHDVNILAYVFPKSVCDRIKKKL